MYPGGDRPPPPVTKKLSEVMVPIRLDRLLRDVLRRTRDGYFATRYQTKVLSTTGRFSSEASTRSDIRSVPWNVYHLLVGLPTALGV